MTALCGMTAGQKKESEELCEKYNTIEDLVLGGFRLNEVDEGLMVYVHPLQKMKAYYDTETNQTIAVFPDNE